MIICPNMSNPDVAREFNEIKDAIEAVKPGMGEIAAYQVWSLNNGNGIDKAPNGAKSVLFDSLLEYYNGDRNKAIVAKTKTYSTNFLKWFGNWTGEKDALPEYEQQQVSKIVDENGEPRVIFHTTRLVGDPNFETFNTEIRGFKSAIYGSDNLSMSQSYMSPDEAEFMLDEKYNYSPQIPILVEYLQKDFPDINWYYFDYDNLPKDLQENEYVKMLEELLELNDLDSNKIENNMSIYRNSVVEYEIYRGDHFEYRYKTLTTPFTKALFYNIKNPIIIDAYNKNWNKIDGDSVFSKISDWKRGVDPDLKDKIGSLYYETADGLERKRTIKTRDIEDAFRDTKYDGVIIENVRDYGGPSQFTPVSTVYIAYKPNQVKHADNRNMQYAGDNMYNNQRDYDFERESIEYNNWLSKANEKLRQSSPKNSEQLKDQLVQEFKSKNFKHFEIHPKMNQDQKWYLSSKNKLDSKDFQDIRRVAKTVWHTNAGVQTIESKDVLPLLKFIFSQVHGESTHYRDLLNVIYAALKDSGVKIQFVENSFRDAPAYYNHQTGVITVNTNGVFVNSNGFDNVVAQTLLHELLHAVTVETIKHSSQLRSELESLFNKVKDSAAVKAYMAQRQYGLTDIYEFLAELSNESFVDILKKVYTGSETKSLFNKAIDFLKKVANSVLSHINKKWNGTAYADAMEILLKASLPQAFNVNIQSEPQDEQTIFNSISARQQAAQDEANRLIVRMNVLYKQYEKMKDKTGSQQKIADRIFETLNKLKQHRNIAAVGIALEQAKLSLGQYNEATAGPATMSTANIYDFLYNAKKNNFDGVEPKQLVDMYRNTIKFYSDLISGIPSEQVIDLSEEDKNNIRDLKSLIEDHIMPLWIEAIMKVGDDIVDATIDEEVESSEENKEDMKKVAKDWLHKNMMYGDVTAFTSYVYNYSYSSNPIIKQAFHLIQHAEQRTLEEMHHIAPKLMKAYQKANTGARSYTPGWQSIMMEYDDEGIPTGNFIRAINFGLYQKDLNKFIKQLNDDFVNRYGFTYVTDDTGAVVNSLTGEFADDEEWVGDTEPKYVEYQRLIEQFKSNRVHRRFTGDYYLERLTKPYDGNIDPLSPEFKNTRFNHGLSPKALKRYSYYQTNINYYLNKCQDEETGLVYPERLEDADKLQLEQWMAKLDKFANIFNEDGSYKVGEDLKMAYEVRAWQRWIGSKTNRNRNQDEFNKELNELYQKSIAEGNPKIYQDFLRFNASTGINPDFILQTVGSLNSGKPDTDLSLRGKLMRASLENQVKMQFKYDKRLAEKRNDPLFWLRCKESDQYVEDASYPKTKGSWTKDEYEKFLDNFYYRDLLYTDSRGFYVDENGNSISPTDPNVKTLEEAGKLLTFRQWLINEYTNEAMSTGQVTGLIDEATGMPIDFSGLTSSQIRKLISELLSYRRHIVHDDGSVEERNEPLSIFTMLTPKTDSFFNKRTGKQEKTIVYLGERRFLDSVSSYKDTQFDPNGGVAEVPDINVDGGRYDNSEAYQKMRSDKDVSDLYDLLIDTMSQSQQIYSTNRKFNYKVPAINARTAALFSRILKRGYSTKAIQSIWQSITSIEENDEDMRTKQDYFIGVDGEIANDVPLKFIRNLKDPQNLSTDLVSSVILFADMALNYKNKTGIDASLKLLRYNMDPEVRNIYDNKLKPKSEPKSESNAQSIKMYDSMMDVLMYGNKYGDRTENGPSKITVGVQKTADAFQSLESSAMLGLNMFSMSVGFADSITRIFSESVAGKYMTTGDCLFALAKCLYYTPACIKNMFNPLANNKLSALMQINGISKGTYGTYVKADWGKGRKFLSNVLMGGWSMLDWMANALLMTAFYHNVRFYEGLKDEYGNDVIEAGFYGKYDLQQAFLRAGRTKEEANAVHRNIGNLGNRITLWDAYYFSKGEAILKPQYEPYVTQKIKTRLATKTKKRGALYNGMNPDNDVPRWKRDVIGRLVGALRGWIVQQFQHLVAGGTDSVARDFYTETKYETTSSGTRSIPKLKKQKLTDEQRSRMQAWDYETGTTQDQILIGLWRSFKTLYRESQQLLLSKPKTAKLSEVEKYAWKDTIIFLSMLALMMVGWTYIHDDARTVQPPKTRAEAGPATWWNPIDYYDYINRVYIPNQYWKLAVDDIYFRTVEAKISNVNPQQVLDIVSSLTALKSGLDDQLGIFGIASDLINGEDNNEVLKQGAYKFYTKGDRTLYRAIGPAKNLHTALTYYGATNNLRWYTNKFGVIYRAFGYDFKKKDKDAANKNKKQSSGFSGGNFSGGNFSGGNFSGGSY